MTGTFRSLAMLRLFRNCGLPAAPERRYDRNFHNGSAADYSAYTIVIYTVLPDAPNFATTDIFLPSTASFRHSTMGPVKRGAFGFNPRWGCGLESESGLQL